MRKILQTFFGLTLASIALTSYAIQVSVQSSSSEVAAIGFEANGKNYGGMGKSYYKKDAPVGSYSFGIRINSIFSKNITCFTSTGKKYVTLKKDTKATLVYNNHHCVMSLS